MHLPIVFVLLLATSLSVFSSANAQGPGRPQRVIIVMMDGFGEDYYRASDMPTLNRMEREGLYEVAPGLMPSVTNVNNASIITGEAPEMNGITGNVFLDPATGREEYTEDPKQVLIPTLFERAGMAGVKSMLLSCKTKTVQLLRTGAGDTLSWEFASPEWIRRLGPKPDIYSREVNYWIMEAALYSIAHDPALGLVFIHTTDYPMHTWAPKSPESREHLHRMDGYIARLIQAAPDAAILITADHTVHHKSRCWDLDKACAERGLQLKAAISPEKDRYFKHHLGLGGSAYIYLKDAADSGRARKLLMGLAGVEEVISRKEAVRRYRLMPERIGDLMVMADSTTVFGHLEKASYEQLAAGYRSHGSAYEARVPMFVYNAKGAPGREYFTGNYKLATWLYRTNYLDSLKINLHMGEPIDSVNFAYKPNVTLTKNLNIFVKTQYQFWPANADTSRSFNFNTDSSKRICSIVIVSVLDSNFFKQVKGILGLPTRRVSFGFSGSEESNATYFWFADSYVYIWSWFAKHEFLVILNRNGNRDDDFLKVKFR